MSRVENIKKNILYGGINSVFNSLISFVTRTIFINILGAEYLGLNGLFTNVLGILSLADLGISSAITFSLYKPISDNNQEKISQIIHFLKKAYLAIGTTIFVLGCCLMPFLNKLVNLDNSIDVNYHLIYSLFLLGSVSGYLFFSYKNTVIYAAQKNYLTTKFEIGYTTLSLIIQLVVLLIFNNYYIYLIVPIVINLVKNYQISKVAEELYPVIKKKNSGEIGPEEKKTLFKNIYALSLLKISSVVYTSTDNLIISSMISTVLVGYYSNYLMIINLIKQFVTIIFGNMNASVGDLNASETKEYKYDTFKKLNFLNFIVYSYCFTCLLHLSNPFICIWLGEQYTFDIRTVLIICLNFLVPGLNNVINIFKDACGLFWETRFRTLITAIVNLIVSIILVKYLGFEGVLLGTIIAYLITIYTFDPYTVFSKVFEINVKEYYKKLIKYSVAIFIINLIILYVKKFILMNNLISIIFSLIIITIIFGLVIVLLFYKSYEFNGLKRYFDSLLKK